jgi:3-hydroxyisobutyrate dehydrogenase
MSISVAVIGVGTMGAPIAWRLHEAGYELTVCDRSPEALGPFAAAGVRTTHSPADCRTANFVLVLVATAAQLMEVVVGADGIASSSDPQRPTVVAVMSTVNPEPIAKLKGALAGTAITIVDAPISGGVVRAQQGTLSVILGGDDDSVGRLRPVVETFGRKIFHVGGLGAAQTVKVINNYLGVATYLVVGEAYRIALDNGLEISALTEVLEASSGRNFLSSDAAEAIATYAAYTRTPEASLSLLSILRKDLELVGALAESADASFPVATGLRSILSKLGEESIANWSVIGRQHETS